MLLHLNFSVIIWDSEHIEKNGVTFEIIISKFGNGCGKPMNMKRFNISQPFDKYFIIYIQIYIIK